MYRYEIIIGKVETLPEKRKGTNKDPQSGKSFDFYQFWVETQTDRDRWPQRIWVTVSGERSAYEIARLHEGDIVLAAGTPLVRRGEEGQGYIHQLLAATIVRIAVSQERMIENMADFEDLQSIAPPLEGL